MKKIILFTSLLLSITYINSFAQAPGAKMSPDDEAKLTYAKEIINKITAPDFSGRGFVKNADKKTADYITNEFFNMQMIPINGTFQHKFNFTANTFPNKLDVIIDKVPLKAGQDYFIDPGCPAITGEFKAKYVTRKQVADNVFVIGKITDTNNGVLVIDDRDDANETQAQKDKINKFKQTILTSAEVKLSAVIILTKGTQRWRTATSQNLRPVVYVTAEIENAVDLEKVQLNILPDFKQNATSQNVVGLIEGTVKKDSFIVIGANYDHLGMMGDVVTFPGANNNASGVSVLLNLAKHFSNIKHPYSIVFVAFGGKEAGMAGSKSFVSSCPVNINAVKFMVNVDLIGSNENGLRVVNGQIYTDRFTKLESINKEFSYLPSLDAMKEVCNSDHCAFHQKGIPSLAFFGKSSTMLYRELGDDATTVTYTNYVNTIKLLTRFIESINK